MNIIQDSHKLCHDSIRSNNSAIAASWALYGANIVIRSMLPHEFLGGCAAGAPSPPAEGAVPMKSIALYSGIWLVSESLLPCPALNKPICSTKFTPCKIARNSVKNSLASAAFRPRLNSKEVIRNVKNSKKHAYNILKFLQFGIVLQFVKRTYNFIRMRNVVSQIGIQIFLKARETISSQRDHHEHQNGNSVDCFHLLSFPLQELCTNENEN